MSCTQLLDANQKLAVQYLPAPASTPGIPKVMLKCTGSFPAVAPLASFGVASISSTLQAGVTLITFTTPFPDTNYLCFVTTFNPDIGGSNAESVMGGYEIVDASSCIVRTNITDNKAIDNIEFCFLAYHLG